MPALCRNVRKPLGNLVLDAGAPKGVWTNLFISSDQVAEVIADKRVRGVALTGSEGAGSAVAEERPENILKNQRWNWAVMMYSSYSMMQIWNARSS